MVRTQDDIVAALRASGRRITPQRMAIIEYLAGRPDHPSARQIHHDLEDRKPCVSVATVYNTLASLVELGLLKEMEFESADNRYDTNLTPHINLVCTVCGAIADLVCDPPLSARETCDRVGFETTGMRIEYQGVCNGCRTLAAGHDRGRRGGERS